MRIRSALLASLLTGTSLVGLAQEVGQHPAVFAPRELPGVNASTFLVGHPASPTWKAARANQEHPAVVVKRTTGHSIDPNTFIVQPPAHAEWTVRGADAEALAEGGAVDRAKPTSESSST